MSGKSIMGVMMFAAIRPARGPSHREGSDEEDARAQLVDLIGNYFGEGC